MTRGGGRRHRGRELALRVLFEVEGSIKDPAAALDYQAQELGATEDVRAFARHLVYGCLDDLDQVDGRISEATENWELGDVGKVERAVLRLGTFELLNDEGTPVPVVINESVELAKTYAGEDAGSFVNGVLGRVAAIGEET